jgi:glycerol-3-phosphate O-acyltransferase / dihydroxyacetone phosphate acyltransferase
VAVIAPLIRAAAAWAAAAFYRVERRGPAVPPGPVLLVANHPNSLLDPLVLFRTAGRPSRPLARAPLFDRPVIGRLIRAVGGIPVHRREDAPALMARNRDALRATIEALRAGDAVQIFAEGRSHSDPAVGPLRTGAARIALGAESEAEWSLGVVIVPVGLTYARKTLFRSHVVALYGEAIPVESFRERHDADEQAAVRALTGEIGRRLRVLTLDLARTEDAAIIDTAERIWSRGTGLTSSRQRVPLAERLPRLQAFARGLAWIRVHDPDRHRRLESAIRRYRRRIRVLGAGEADVPERYRLVPVARWAATRAMPVLLLAPVGLIAVVAWGLPYLFVGRLVGRMRLPADVVATYKVGAAVLAYPLVLTFWAGLAAWKWTWLAALAVALVLPVLGYVTTRWLDAAREVMEDLRLFIRLARLRRRRGATRTRAGTRKAGARLEAERRAVTSEIEAIRAIMDSGERPGQGEL